MRKFNSLVAVSAVFMATAVVATAHAAPILGPNLVANGNFEAGNTGFTSQYQYSATGGGAEGVYDVDTSANPWNGNWVTVGDHTTGQGKFMMINGATTLTNPAPRVTWRSDLEVWRSQPFQVFAGGTYHFEAWAMSACCLTRNDPSPAQLRFQIDLGGNSFFGIAAGTAPAVSGVWQRLYASWTAPADATISLRLLNDNTARSGNDFAVDDIHFGAAVSEPATLALLGAGLLGLATLRRRRA